MSDLTGRELSCCGICCTQCAIYIAAQSREKAEELAGQWREKGFPKAVPEWFVCEGCHGDDAKVWSENCRIRACCLTERKLDNCSHCSDFPCREIEKFANGKYAHHRQAVDRLRRMRQERS